MSARCQRMEAQFMKYWHRNKQNSFALIGGQATQSGNEVKNQDIPALL